MFTPELDVLKPIDPSISNSDEYEIFTLSNAQVLYASNGKPASLLSAYADTPLRVEGRMEAPDRAQMKYLVKKPFKPVDIQISDVTRFSYGQTQDGEIVIWALGGAGWFEIRPAKSYKEIFQDMLQAVEILYFVTDIYNEPRKRGGGPGAQLIFQEYVEDERFACKDLAQAARIFHKHRTFLLMCFLNRAQGIGWSNTPIYQYLRRHFPNDFDNAKARVEGKLQPKLEKPSKTAPSAAPKPRARGKEKAQPKPLDAPKKDENWWESAAIFEFMQKAVNQGAMHIGHITIDRIAKLLVKRYEIDEVDIARNVILVHAENLYYIMEHPRRKNIQYFADEPIYQELSSGHNLSAADIRRAQGIELRPRKNHGTLKEDMSDSEDLSDKTKATPQRRRSGKKKGRLSVLRPKSSQYSGKGKGVKQGKGKGKKNLNALADDESEETSASARNENESDSDGQIDTPTQGLSPGKRKHVPDSTENTNRRKRAASHSADLESPPESPSSSNDNDTEAPIEPLPLRWRSGNMATKSSSPALLPPVVSTPLPTYAANGPGDSWLCTFDGCSQKVYGASSSVGTTLIKEHLQDHSRGRALEIGLVMSEEQKLRLPVDNLIKRIREMAEHQQPLFPTMGLGGSAMRPSPIERSV